MALEREAAQRIVDRLTPAPDAIEGYSRKVERFRGLGAGPEWKLRRSRNFPGISFLVGFTEGAGGQLLEDDDALVLPEFQHPWGGVRPCHVRARASDVSRKDREFCGILEHEFVHVCQNLAGWRCEALVAPGADSCVAAAVSRAWSEFEAHLVQHVLVDRASPHRGPVTAPRYALLRAFHPVVEELAALAPPGGEHAWRQTVIDVFETVRGRVVEECGAWSHMTEEFRGHLPGYVEAAWTRGQLRLANRRRPPP